MLVISSLSVICKGPVQFDRPWSYRWGAHDPDLTIAVVVRSKLWRMSEILPLYPFSAVTLTTATIALWEVAPLVL